MRIHADNLTRADVYKAAHTARATLERFTDHGSRSRDHAFDVTLSGESNRRPNRAHDRDEFAATWDQWGVFLQELFAADQTITIPTAYKTYEDFLYHTDSRFSEGFPEDEHGDHTFRYTVGVPGSQSCTKCSAIYRWI